MTDQRNADQPDGSQGTTEGNEQAAEGSNVDKNHKAADKPIQPNQDVKGTQGPAPTTE